MLQRKAVFFFGHNFNLKIFWKFPTLSFSEIFSVFLEICSVFLKISQYFSTFSQFFNIFYIFVLYFGKFMKITRDYAKIIVSTAEISEKSLLIRGKKVLKIKIFSHSQFFEKIAQFFGNLLSFRPKMTSVFWNRAQYFWKNVQKKDWIWFTFLAKQSREKVNLFFTEFLRIKKNFKNSRKPSVLKRFQTFVPRADISLSLFHNPLSWFTDFFKN